MPTNGTLPALPADGAAAITVVSQQLGAGYVVVGVVEMVVGVIVGEGVMVLDSSDLVVIALAN